jgi:hypothetical protein
MAYVSKADREIKSFIRSLSHMKDADPSLKTDPTYWHKRIKETGGCFTAEARAYWRMRGKRDGSPSVMAGYQQAKQTGQPEPAKCFYCGRPF